MPQKEMLYAIQSMNATRETDDRVRRVCRHKNRANEMAPQCLKEILKYEVSDQHSYSRFGRGGFSRCYYDESDSDSDSLHDLDSDSDEPSFKEAFDSNLLYCASRKKDELIVRIEVIERDLETLRAEGEFEIDEEEGVESDQQIMEREGREDLLKEDLIELSSAEEKGVMWLVLDLS